MSILHWLPVAFAIDSKFLPVRPLPTSPPSAFSGNTPANLSTGLTFLDSASLFAPLAFALAVLAAEWLIPQMATWRSDLSSNVTSPQTASCPPNPVTSPITSYHSFILLSAQYLTWSEMTSILHYRTSLLGNLDSMGSKPKPSYFS